MLYVQIRRHIDGHSPTQRRCSLCCLCCLSFSLLLFLIAFFYVVAVVSGGNPHHTVFTALVVHWTHAYVLPKIRRDVRRMNKQSWVWAWHQRFSMALF